MNNTITNSPILFGKETKPDDQIGIIVKNNSDLWRRVDRLEEAVSKNTELTKGRIGDASSISDLMDYIERERIESRLFSLMCSEI
jgi:hypothetical protein